MRKPILSSDLDKDPAVLRIMVDDMLEERRDFVAQLALADELAAAAKRTSAYGMPCLCCDKGFEDMECTCFEGMARDKETMVSLKDALEAYERARGGGK